MANYRVELALDRTTLTWVRTTLTASSVGFGMVAFFRLLQEQTASVQSIRLHQGGDPDGYEAVPPGIV
jgi:putative membrane protein